MLGNYVYDEEFLSKNEEILAKAKDYCGSSVIALKSAFDTSKNATYHLLDFMRIAFVTQSLTGRWLYQLFLELEHYKWAPSLEVQKTWLGWPIVVSAFVLAIATKSYNHYYKENYPAAQDYLFAAFSSSILYFILDTISESGKVGTLSIGWFIAATILVPIVSVRSSNSALPDSQDHIITLKELKREQTSLNSDRWWNVDDFENKQEPFPIYQDASRPEKALNAISGYSYSSAISILFWTANREIYKKTVGTEAWQLALIALYSLASLTIGWNLTTYPKIFHGFAAFSKAARDGSFAYAAFSGLGFLFLTYGYQCGTEACWGDEINVHLSKVFIVLSIMIGLFSGLTTLFRYQQNREGTLELIETIKNIPDTIRKLPETVKETVTETLQSIPAKISDCTNALLSKCRGEEKEKENFMPNERTRLIL